MKLKKTINEAEEIINLVASNQDLIGFYGDGKNIPEVPEIPLKHSFADQIYIRQMNMKAGQVVVGAIHNHLHAWFLLTGKVYIIESEEKIEHIAPCYTISKPGAQRVIYAVEDSIFVNIHKNPSNTQNIKELEKQIISFTKEEFNNQKK
jgi:hypothetical protein